MMTAMATAGFAVQPAGDCFPDRQDLYLPQAVARICDATGGWPVWSDEMCPDCLAQLLSAIESAEDHGLRPEDYHFQALEEALGRGDIAGIGPLATDAFLLLARDLSSGVSDPAVSEPGWPFERPSRDLDAVLLSALASGDIAAALADLAPSAPSYVLLQEALAHYQRMSGEAGWEPLEEGPLLRVGDHGPAVRALQRRLAVEDLLQITVDNDGDFDADTQAAVKAFQRRTGLSPDGIVGPLTLRELNRTPEERIAQVRVNLERWRWMPRDLGRRYILVNIPAFSLEAHEENGTVEVHKVIVGRQTRQTPLLSAPVRYVVFNPWWEVPPNMARADKLPDFQKNPGSVRSLGFVILDGAGRPVDPDTVDWKRYSADTFPFRLRQRPGPSNALGKVKLIFPNRHNVYLHDTPSRALFGQEERTFSSGCIRVEDALGLARWALAETPDAVAREQEAAVASGREKRMDLAAPLPVHILYLTAAASPEGTLIMYDDVYGRDGRVLQALDAPARRGADMSSSDTSLTDLITTCAAAG